MGHCEQYGYVHPGVDMGPSSEAVCRSHLLRGPCLLRPGTGCPLTNNGLAWTNLQAVCLPSQVKWKRGNTKAGAHCLTEYTSILRIYS